MFSHLGGKSELSVHYLCHLNVTHSFFQVLLVRFCLSSFDEGRHANALHATVDSRILIELPHTLFICLLVLLQGPVQIPGSVAQGQLSLTSSKVVASRFLPPRVLVLLALSPPFSCLLLPYFITAKRRRR